MNSACRSSAKATRWWPSSTKYAPPISKTSIADVSPLGKAVLRFCSRLLDSPPPGLEVTVHVPAAVYRPDDPVERDLVDAEVRLPRDPKPATRLSERQQAHGI